jgi:YebC/PmpR family DNA-binding regulatory protein
MAGHSHWKQIKIKKGLSDKKKGAAFSKLLNAITVAAKQDPSPQFNPRLRSVIEKAKQSNVPKENIEKAIKKAEILSDELKEILLEAYGPGGVAILIEAITNSKNKTIQEIKLLFKELGLKWAEPGSVKWAFTEPDKNSLGYNAKFFQEISSSEKEKLLEIVKKLERHDDVQQIYHNTPL